MATHSPATSTAPHTNDNRLNKDGKPRKKAERVPRTPEEVAFGACNAVLKRLTPEMRGRVMRSLTALHSVSN